MTDKIIFRTQARAAFLATLFLGVSAAFPCFSNEAIAQDKAPAAAVPLPDYALVADLVTSVPAIASVRVRNLTPIPPERAAGLPAGKRRFLVGVETVTLIRSNDAMARQASVLLDLPDTGDRKTPKWKGRAFLLFGKVEDRVDFFQLQSSAAVLPWSSEVEAMVRRIAGDLAAQDAPPAIRQINSVFHVSGAVQGEGETQIFLDTAKGSSISLSIVRRPDEKPQFGAALGEVVDEAASLPEPNTPLWYRLSCGLPRALPQKALASQSMTEAAAATRDYKDFLAAMAPCKKDPVPL